MEIVISQAAFNWFKEDIGVSKGDTMRFYVQIYGSSPIQKGYSLGFAKEKPIDSAVTKEIEGITFYIEETDVWYFDGHDLHVDYDKKVDELKFEYVRN